MNVNLWAAGPGSELHDNMLLEGFYALIALKNWE